MAHYKTNDGHFLCPAYLPFLFTLQGLMEQLLVVCAEGMHAQFKDTMSEIVVYAWTVEIVFLGKIVA